MRQQTLQACAVALLFVCGVPVGSAAGQVSGPAASTATAADAEAVARIQASISAIRLQIDALPRDGSTTSDTVADLERQLKALEVQLASHSAPGGGQAQPPSAAQTALTLLQSQLGRDPQKDYDQVAQEQFSVVRIDNRPIDETRANFIDLPGTETGFQLGGYAKLDNIFDTRQSGNPDKFVSSTIPVDVPAAGQFSNYNVHARQTRFQLNFIKGTQKSVGGPLRFYVEADFFGGDGQLAFRMRHAYGSGANFVAGFTWSALSDPDALPDTLDFEGPPGTTQNRQPQLRYTKPFGEDKQSSLAVSVEKPTVDVSLLEDTQVSTTVVTRYPDVIARFRQNWEDGHVQAGVAFRSLGASDRTTTTDTAFGIVGIATTSFNVFGNDLITAGITGGRGAAHYISNISGLGLDAAINVPERQLEPLNSIGAYAAYKHFWTDQLRSTASYGFDDVEDNVFLPLVAIQSNHVFSINLILKFLRSATAGVEYLWGDNNLQNGDDGWAQRIQFSLKYDLTK